MKLMIIFAVLLSSLASADLIHQVDETKCNGCGLCVNVCPHGAATMNGNIAVIDPEKCQLSNGCAGACYYHCHNIPAGGDAIYKTDYTGIELTENPNQICLFPLPCSSQLNITGSEAGVEYQIFNLAGRLVLSGNSDSEETSISVSSLTSGVYVLLMDDSFLVTIQVVR